MENYYQKEIECASPEKLRELQDERLVKQVKHVWDNVPYYRKKMEEKGVHPTISRVLTIFTSFRFFQKRTFVMLIPTDFLPLR